MSLNGGERTCSSTGSTKRDFVGLTRYCRRETLDHLVKATMKNTTKLLSVAGLAFAFATCASADITWTLNDVTFSDGNSAVGFFITDNAVDTIESFSIQVEGPDTGRDFTATTMSSAYLPSVIGAFLEPTYYTDLYLVSPMTSAGGTIALKQGYDCPGCGVLASGTVTGAPLGTVPEPRFGALLVIGLAGLAFFARRKSAPARS